MPRLTAFLALASAVVVAPASAQDVSLEEALLQPRVAESLASLEARKAEWATLLTEVGGIVSPSGEEHERAEFIAHRMRAIGLSEVRVTESPNAVGVIPGRTDRALIFVSTLDDLATVAEHQRAASSPPQVIGDRVLGPGTNTSSTSVAILAAAEAYLETGRQPELTLVFAAVAQEETGLRGMKALYEEYRDRAVAFVDVLGDGHSLTYGALGIHWWRVRASGPGGHTLSGGLPNVNQGIGRAVDRILSLPDARRTDDSRTRINVAMLESGAVFNHKPEDGWFSLDIRSMSASTIESIEDQVRDILDAVTAETSIELTMEPFQLTPGGQIPGAERSPLVVTGAEISRHLGYEPNLSNSGSSNMNVAVAGGTLALGLGGSRGGERGQSGEWADIDGMVRTAQHVFLLAVTLGGSE